MGYFFLSLETIYLNIGNKYIFIFYKLIISFKIRSNELFEFKYLNIKSKVYLYSYIINLYLLFFNFIIKLFLNNL